MASGSGAHQARGVRSCAWRSRHGQGEAWLSTGMLRKDVTPCWVPAAGHSGRHARGGRSWAGHRHRGPGIGVLLWPHKALGLSTLPVPSANQAWGDPACPSPRGSAPHPPPPVLCRCAQRRVRPGGPRGTAVCPQSLQHAETAKPWLQCLGCGYRTGQGRAGVFCGGCDLGSEKHPSRRREQLCRQTLRSGGPFSCGCLYSHVPAAQGKGHLKAPRPPTTPVPLERPLQGPSQEKWSLAPEFPRPPPINEASEALLRPQTLPPPPQPSHRPSLGSRDT